MEGNRLYQGLCAHDAHQPTHPPTHPPTMSAICREKSSRMVTRSSFTLSAFAGML